MRPQSMNGFGYVEGDPVNRIDPTDRFSSQQIMQSYHLNTANDLIQAFSSGVFKGRWGWLKLLLDAHSGDTIWAGSPATFPPFLDETAREALSLSNDQIMIGSQELLSFSGYTIIRPMNGAIWWRDTTPHFYYLQGLQYVDADRPRDLPDFRNLDVNLAGAANPLAGTFFNVDVEPTIDMVIYTSLEHWAQVYILVFPHLQAKGI